MTAAPSYPVSYLVTQAVADKVRELALAGIGERVFVRDLPILDGLPTPCVVVSPGSETVDDRGGTNESDDTTYRVIVTLARAATRELDGDRTVARQRAEWRDAVRRAFVNKRITIDGACWVRSTITAGEPMVPEAWRRQYDAQYWVLQFTLREARGD